VRQYDLTERLLRLRGVPVFRGMSTSELAPLAMAMRSATFEKGEVLLREDEPPHAFHMLVTGQVTMWRRGRKIRTITAPGGVGFLPLLARIAGGTEAIADARTESFELSADAIEEMFEDHFSVVLATLRWITERLIRENLTQEPPPYAPSGGGVEHLIGDRELGIVDRIVLLRRTSVFNNANVNSVARLARSMKEVRVPAGEILWRPGDRALGSIFIVKGQMDLRWNEGRSVQVVGPGYIVGGAEAIAPAPRWNELVTTEPAIFLKGSREALIDMFEDDLDVALQFMSMIARVLLMQWDRRADAEARAAEGAGRSDVHEVASRPSAPPPARGRRSQ
jgi:CRP-like cAMP-binding protein